MGLAGQGPWGARGQQAGWYWGEQVSVPLASRDTNGAAGVLGSQAVES